MLTIATSVDDSFDRMRSKLEAEKARPNHAIDPYFYRSHLVHEQELGHLIFRYQLLPITGQTIPGLLKT